MRRSQTFSGCLSKVCSEMFADNIDHFTHRSILGLYLFLQVQASFSVGRLKLRHCVSIGWGNYKISATVDHRMHS